MTEGDMSTYGRHMDETQMPRKLKAKTQPFLELKQKTCFSILLDYVIIHIGTNDVMNYEVSDNVKKILQVKRVYQTECTELQSYYFKINKET